MRGQVRLLVAVVLAATLAACGSNADPTPTSTEPLVPSGSVVESSGVPASSPAGPTSGVLEPSTFASTSAGGLTVAPLPAGLTQEQLADATAALGVYRQYWALLDEANSTPGIDRTEQISRVAIADAAELFAENDNLLVRNGYHTVGVTAVEAQVTKVEPALVHVSACIDVSGTEVVDADGRSLGAADGPGSHLRFISNAQIGQFAGGRWLVTVDNIDRNTTC